MSSKCKPPANMKFGLGEGPHDIIINDRAQVVQAFGLPEGVTINLLRCEVEKGCYNYVAPVIDPCTGEPAVLSAETPTTVLVSEGAHKMEFVGADPEDLPEVGVFCYELKVEASLLLKKADEAGLSPADVKPIVEACLAPVVVDIAANAADVKPTVEACIAPLVQQLAAIQAQIDNDILPCLPKEGDPVTLTGETP